MGSSDPIYFRLAEDEVLLWSSACTQIRMIQCLQQRLASDEWETLQARDEGLIACGIRELIPLCRLLRDGMNYSGWQKD